MKYKNTHLRKQRRERYWLNRLGDDPHGRVVAQRQAVWEQVQTYYLAWLSGVSMVKIAYCVDMSRSRLDQIIRRHTVDRDFKKGMIAPPVEAYLRQEPLLDYCNGLAEKHIREAAALKASMKLSRLIRGRNASVNGANDNT